MIKLVATDMDGTLLDSHKVMPKDFCPWVLAHPEIKVVIASGRQYYTLRDEFEEISDRLTYIAENGCLVFHHGQILYKNVMAEEDVRRCLAIASRFPGVSLIICGVKSAYMMDSSEHVKAQGRMYYHRLTFTDCLAACLQSDEIVKVALYVEGDRIWEIHSSLEGIGEHLKAVVSGSEWIDISNRDVNKGIALNKIQKKHQIAKEESMGFGDYMNDYEMLQQCGESYAMANACEEIRNIAKHITLSNDEDGVMRVLREI